MSYDMIIIGAGPAGYELASILGQAGQKVALISKDEVAVGGTCLTEGCIPAKNFLESSDFVKKTAHFAHCGVDLELKGFDLQVLQDKTRQLQKTLNTGILAKMKQAKVALKYGKASFVAKDKIKVNDEVLSADAIVIATGSKHKNHPLLPLIEDKIIYSKSVFNMKDLPKSILIIGGGAIGCEFASFFHNLGTSVAIAEFTPQLLPNEDEDVAKTIKRDFEKQGMKIWLKANVASYDVRDDGVAVSIEHNGKTLEQTFEKILISIGRSPNTDDLGLETAGITLDKGFIQVDENLQTLGNEGVFALGDVIQSPALAHWAYHEAKVLAAHLLKQDPKRLNVVFPSVTFCNPQVASVGASEQVLKAQGMSYKVKKQFFKASAKAKIKGNDGGFIKVIYEDSATEKSGKILGAAIIGQDATELIHNFLIAINVGLSLKDLAKMVFAHPTLSESILDLAKA